MVVIILVKIVGMKLNDYNYYLPVKLHKSNNFYRTTIPNRTKVFLGCPSSLQTWTIHKKTQSTVFHNFFFGREAGQGYRPRCSLRLILSLWRNIQQYDSLEKISILNSKSISHIIQKLWIILR